MGAMLHPPHLLNSFSSSRDMLSTFKFHYSILDTHDMESQEYNAFKNRATIFVNSPEQVPDRAWFDYLRQRHGIPG